MWLLHKYAPCALSSTGTDSIALRVIADHVRSISLLVSEGVFPSSVNRGYVVRRLIRRAMRYANRLGLNGTGIFFLTLCWKQSDWMIVVTFLAIIFYYFVFSVVLCIFSAFSSLSPLSASSSRFQYASIRYSKIV